MAKMNCSNIFCVLLLLFASSLADEIERKSTTQKLITFCNSTFGQGECIPYFLCDNNQYIIEDGRGIIDWRSRRRRDTDDEQKKECPEPFDRCCALKPIRLNVDENSLKHLHCGSRLVDFPKERKDAKEAFEKEFPWTVMILERPESVTESDQSLYVCGGSLIHPSVILTAAHCIHDKRKRFLFARAGIFNVTNSDEEDKHQNRDIDEILIHEEFNPNNGINNVALAILRSPMIIADNVNTICLADNAQNFTGSKCYASGFGKSPWNHDYSSIMKRIELPVINRNFCEQRLRQDRLGHHFQLHESFLCAGGEVNSDTCEGDGGSPLVCQDSFITNRFYQVGITSWGLRCGYEIPGVYSNVAYLREWIDKQMQQKKLNSVSYRSNE